MLLLVGTVTDIISGHPSTGRSILFSCFLKILLYRSTQRGRYAGAVFPRLQSVDQGSVLGTLGSIS